MAGLWAAYATFLSARIATGGSDLTDLDKHGYSTAIQTQIIEGVFGFCGLKNVKLDILYQADTATPEQVENFPAGAREP